jgi:hypothetical protein
MHTHLTGHGSDVAWFAMDFSGYDNSISVHLIDAAINVLIALTRQLTGYTDEDRRVMRTICYDLCNPIYNMNGLYFQIAGSNASGNPLTTMLNCMVNHVAWNQMWLMWNWDRTNPDMVGEYHKLTESYATYYDNVRMVVMGDDFLAGVLRKCGFTQLDAVKYASRIGLTLTAASKDADVTEYTTGITFLKREVVVYKLSDGGKLVLAPLCLESLFKPLVWGTWKVDVISHLAGLIKGIVTELVQHGPEVYDNYVAQLRGFVETYEYVHTTGAKNAVPVREPLVELFDLALDFRPWSQRISEMYDLGDATVLPGSVTL